MVRSVDCRGSRRDPHPDPDQRPAGGGAQRSVRSLPRVPMPRTVGYSSGSATRRSDTRATSSSVSGRPTTPVRGASARSTVGSPDAAPIARAVRNNSRTADRRRCIVATDGSDPSVARARTNAAACSAVTPSRCVTSRATGHEHTEPPDQIEHPVRGLLRQRAESTSPAATRQSPSPNGPSRGCRSPCICSPTSAPLTGFRPRPRGVCAPPGPLPWSISLRLRSRRRVKALGSSSWDAASMSMT